jgi:tetratricopeptide (TPR) repeat protein
MEILTGGSPRLLAILADFAKGRSLAELMEDLVILIDDHTTYFKANVESLPSMERRVFVTLAEIWEPAEARQVAERCRLSVNTASAMLKKLVGRGAVAETGKIGRKNLYQIVERLYNIYHLMRLSGVDADRVRALVRFMVPLYGKEKVACALADEACRHDGLGRLSWIEGYRTILDEASHEEGGLDRLFSATPAVFFTLPEVSEVINQYKPFKEKPSKFEVQVNEAEALFLKGIDLLQLGRTVEAIQAYDELINRFGNAEELALRENVAGALVNKGFALESLGQEEEAFPVYDDMIARFGNAEEFALRHPVAWMLVNKGVALGRLGRAEEEIEVYDDVIARFGNAEELALREQVARVLFNKGFVLGSLGQSEEEITVYDALIARFENAEELALCEQVAKALVNKGFALEKLGREDAISVYDEVIARFGNATALALCEGVARALVNKGVALGSLGRGEEAITVYDDVIARFGNAEELSLREQVARALVNKGFVLGSLGRAEEEITVYDDVIARFGNAEELRLREGVARSLVNKGFALGRLGRGEESITVYDEVIARFGNAEEPALREQVAKALNAKSWKVYEGGKSSEVAQAITDIEKAISIMPQEENFLRHTLACLLGLASKWEEAFENAKKFSDDPDMVEKCPQNILAFFVDAAAAGQAEHALQAIEGTKLEHAMEPLVVALKTSAGKPYRAPLEVEEMAKDIQARIQQRKENLQSKEAK